MAANKRPPKPGSNKKPEQSMYQRISTALNPMTYARPAAQGQMESWKENYGGGARRRRIDAEVDTAVNGRPSPQSPPSATFTAAKKRSRSK